MEGALRRAARYTGRTFRVPPPSGEVSRLAVTEGAFHAPFDIIAAGNPRQFRYTGVPKARQGDLMRSLRSRENGRKESDCLFSRREATYRVRAVNISKAPKREVLFGAYIELRGSARNISSARRATHHSVAPIFALSAQIYHTARQDAARYIMCGVAAYIISPQGDISFGRSPPPRAA